MGTIQLKHKKAANSAKHAELAAGFALYAHAGA